MAMSSNSECCFCEESVSQHEDGTKCAYCKLNYYHYDCINIEKAAYKNLRIKPPCEQCYLKFKNFEKGQKAAGAVAISSAAGEKPVLAASEISSLKDKVDSLLEKLDGSGASLNTASPSPAAPDTLLYQSGITVDNVRSDDKDDVVLIEETASAVSLMDRRFDVQDNYQAHSSGSFDFMQQSSVPIINSFASERSLFDAFRATGVTPSSEPGEDCVSNSSDIHPPPGNSTSLDRGAPSHESQHARFPCNMCTDSFAHPVNLRKHKREIHHVDERHKGERVYRCNYCSATFRQSGNRDNHQISLHTKDFKFKCELCGRGFISRFVLRKHQIRLHNMI